MSLMIETPNEIGLKIAHRFQARRLSLNFTQKTLAARSGVSLGVIKKFERAGKISLESLLKLGFILGFLDDLQSLFLLPPAYPASLDEVLKKNKVRKRGRK